MVTSSAEAQAQNIRIATEGFYVPFNSFADNGQLIGFDIDIANALCDTPELSVRSRQLIGTN